MRCLLGTLALVLLVGCRSQSTAMTNPFLAPDRVPPPATRTLLPGTAQPYYPGDPVPTSPAIGTPLPAAPPMPTYTQPPAGTVPPNGWNATPQPMPQGAVMPPVSSMPNVMPSGIQPTNNGVVVNNQTAIQIQQDNQALRFAQQVPTFQPDVVSADGMQAAEPVVMATAQVGASPYYPNQVVSYESPLPPQMQYAPPTGGQREVRIRAISSSQAESLSADGVRSRDGFRPQGSSRVQKPTIASRVMPQKIQPTSSTDANFDFDTQYQWLRGQLLYSQATGSWELLYSTPDEPADAFGGRLPIANPQVLGALQPGDFVQLGGRVEQAATGQAAYQVSVVQRQRI